MRHLMHRIGRALGGSAAEGQHGHIHGEINRGGMIFGIDLDGDDPVGIDANMDDPGADMGLPIADPWGVEARDIVDEDWNPVVKSGRTGSVTNHRLYDDIRPTFGLEDEMYSGFGPAVLMGCERFG